MAFTEIAKIPNGYRQIQGSKFNEALDAINAIMGYPASGYTPTASSKLFGAGTSSSPYAMGTTAGQNLIGYWATTTATSGDTRLAYFRLYFSGAGVSGEALRAYGTVNEVAAASGGTVNGAHISLSVTASGSISGAGHAGRFTMDYAAASTPGGTVDCVQLDTNFGAGATVQSTFAFLRFANLTAVRSPNLLAITSPDTTDMFVDAGTASGSPGYDGGAAKALKIQIDGTDYWLAAFAANGS